MRDTDDACSDETRAADTAAGPAPEDDTAILPNHPPTERATLAWSEELEPELEPVPFMPAPFRPVRNPRTTETLLVCIVLLVGAVVLIGWIRDIRRGPSVAPSASSSAAATTTTTPPAHQTIPGDGSYRVGTVDGKDFGSWEARAVSRCIWSVVVKDPYSAAFTVDHGVADAGEVVRVSVQPIGDHDLLFITSGCGSWRLVD